MLGWLSCMANRRGIGHGTGRERTRCL